MTVTINGTTGIAGTNGSAGTPAVQGEDTNTGIFFPAADTVAVATGGSERLRVDSSGNLGLGTTSPQAYSGYTVATVDNATNGGLVAIRKGGTSYLNLYTATGEARIEAANSAVLELWTSGVERMRIDSSGRALIGATSFSQNTGASFGAGSLYVNDNIFIANSSGTGNRNVRIDGFSNEVYFVWADGNLDNNSIKYAFGGTAWVNTSDETLKDIIEPITDAVSKVCSLRSVIGKYKNEEDGVRHPFLIAQDVQAVLPEAVYTNKSRVEGEPDTLGVGYTDVIPLLVAAIKELKAEVDSLKAQLEAK